MKNALLLISLFISFTSGAQKIYFSSQNYRDSASIVQAMPELAVKIIAHYTANKNPDKLTYWDDVFRFHMLRREFVTAQSLIDSIRNAYRIEDGSAVIGIQYESFMKAKAVQAKTNQPFEKIYTSMLDEILGELSEPMLDIVPYYLTTDLRELRTNFRSILEGLHESKSDSIDLKTAGALCRIYNSYEVFTSINQIAGAALKSTEQKKYFIEDSVIFNTSSGIRLSGVVARKVAVTTPLPAILKYSIYPGLGDRIDVKLIAQKDYVGVVINTRGKYLSHHVIEPFEHDAQDAYEIIDWISRQPWCNGSVGMYGGSYLGFSQWSSTKKLHPALKTIVPQVAVGAGIDYPAPCNIFMSYSLQWIHYVTNNKLTDYTEFFDEDRWNNLNKKWYVSGKSFNSLDSMDERPNAIFQRWLNHPSYDAYWQKMTPQKEEFSKINIPVLTTTGYYDDDQRGALYYFNEHYLYNKNADHYLLIGPYDHGGAQGLAKPELNGYILDSAANINVNETVFQWFDHIFKKGPMPPLLKDKINYQVMGSNSWKHVNSLQLISNDTIRFYLSNRKEKDYLLSNFPSSRKFISQTISLNDRSNANFTTNEFRVLDSTLQAANGLIFVSEPIKTATEISGSFFGDLKLKINKKDLDVYVKLYEQTPQGNYMLLSNTLVRASYAKDRTTRHLLTPGREETIPINNTFFVSRKIEIGSRIVVVLGINKNRDWQVNYGTGKDVSKETIHDADVPLKIKWSCSSNINLPVYRTTKDKILAAESR
jgi:putative CocE/NonD family hydrolase